MLTNVLKLTNVSKLTTVQGASEKKGDLFYDQYLHQIEHKSAGYVFDLKGGIHSSFWSTKKYLYDIRSRDISKSK